MKKHNKLSLLFLLLLGLSAQVVAQDGKPVSLGGTKAFLTSLRTQINAATTQRSTNPTLKVKTSGKESLNLVVNFKQSDGQNHQYIAGKVANNSSSDFFIRIKDNKLEGNIVLKDSKEAYSYYSDNKGNAYIKSVDIHDVLCVEYYTPPANAPTASSSNAPVVAMALNNLQSLPGANGCVLLDFDGHYVSGTPWNGGNPINAAPSGMSDAAVQEHWEIVAEDFRPFSVNITTNEAVFNSYPKNRRMRCIITPTNTAAPGAGGVAYIGSFNWNDDTPCWVFITSGKAGGEASSHEIGHTFGLGHDGRNSPAEGYYAGHGDWAPIMGVGYYENISQWSRGEYNSANNMEDDLAKIASATYGVGYRGDDHGNAMSSAKALVVSGTSVSASQNFGFIGQTSDVDFFSFNTGAGTVTLNFNTVSRHSDLDILVRLYTESGAQIGTFNPAGQSATMVANLGQGKYYVSVDGTGFGNPATDGYSDYASLGNYYISGTIPTPAPTGVATMYKDCNYGGYAVGLGVGDYNLGDLNARGILNDDISSIRVNSGYEVVLYNDANFAGTALTVTADNSCLVANGFNDLTSSLRVRVVTPSFSQLIQAENYGAMAGVQTEACTDAGGGLNVGYIEAGDWMAYYNITFPTSGAYNVEYRVASITGAQLSLDLNAGSIQLGTVNIPATGGWQNWTTVSKVVNINAGTYNVGIFAQQTGWNINWFRITRVSGVRVAMDDVEDVETNYNQNAVADAGFEVSPNPVMSELTLNAPFDVAGGQVKIMDAMGQEIMAISNTALTVDVSSLPQGIYTLFYTKAGKKISRRFVKN